MSTASRWRFLSSSKERPPRSSEWKEGVWLRAPLEHAAARGNLGLFRRLADAGASAEAGWRGCHGRTLLGAAACGQNEKVVRALLTAGARSDVNVLFGAERKRVALLLQVVSGGGSGCRGGLQGAHESLEQIGICAVGGIVVHSTSLPRQGTTES
ncbi:unnamed protein product [Ectocarpus fasciculatus]